MTDPYPKGLSKSVEAACRPVLRVAAALLALLTVAAVLQVGEPAVAAPPTPPKQATAIGTGGAAASVDPLATKTAIDVRRRGTRSRRALLVRHRRRRLHDDLPRQRRPRFQPRRTRDRSAGVPAGQLHRPRDRASDPVRRGRDERPRRRRTRDASPVGGGPRALRAHAARRGPRAGDRDRPRGLRG